MEFPIRLTDRKGDVNIIDELTFAKKNVIKTVGRDFNRSVCNMIGLINLLKDEDPTSDDYQSIRKYLSDEASNMHNLIKNICKE